MIELIESEQELATLIFSAVVALSTVVYAVLTALLVSETRQMRRAQTEPKLVAFIEPREEFVNFGHLYIENVGAGPAFDVSFDLIAKEEDEGAKLLVNDFTKSRFFSTGVDYVGASQKLRSRYTSFTEEYEKKIQAVLTVRLSYRSSTRTQYTDTYSIDLSQFEGAGGLGTPSLYSIAQSLKKLQEDVHSVTRGIGRVKVDNFSHEDRERKAAEWEEHRERMRQQIAGSEDGSNK
jgi:hypothetical protein